MVSLHTNRNITKSPCYKSFYSFFFFENKTVCFSFLRVISFLAQKSEWMTVVQSLHISAIYLSIYLSIYLPTYLSIYLSIYHLSATNIDTQVIAENLSLIVDADPIILFHIMALCSKCGPSPAQMEERVRGLWSMWIFPVCHNYRNICAKYFQADPL